MPSRFDWVNTALAKSAREPYEIESIKKLLQSLRIPMTITHKNCKLDHFYWVFPQIQPSQVPSGLENNEYNRLELKVTRLIEVRVWS